MEAGRRGGKLKQRLSRLFLSACKPSATAVSSAASTRAPLLEDAVLEPDFFPSRRRDSPASLDEAARRRRSVDCRGGCRPSLARTPTGMGKKERRLRETGGYYETGEWEGMTCLPASPSSPSKSSFYYYCLNDGAAASAAVKGEKKKKQKKAKKSLQSNGYGFSSSSSMGSEDNEEEEVEDDGFFSSEEREGKGEETEALFSSRSFSSDSSEFYRKPASNNTNKKNKKKKKPPPPPQQRQRKCLQRRRGPAKKHETWGGGCKGFQPLISSVGGPEARNKRRGGFAVVRRSSDPYGDFRSSMAEMIIEKQIFSAEDLENLLQSYLSLNSKHLHPLILQAFSDIWVILLDHQQPN